MGSTTDAGDVIVGFDGSAGSVAAARWAATEAMRRSSALRLMLVYSPPWAPYPGLETSQVAMSQMAHQWALETVTEQAADLRVRFPGLTVTPEVRSGHPVGILTEESRTAALTVVGSHERRGLLAPAALSLPVRLVAHTHGAVIVVPPDDPDGDARTGADVELDARPVVVGVDGSDEGRAAIAFAAEVARGRNAPLHAVLVWDEGPLVRAAAGIPLPLDLDAVRARHHDLIAAAVEPVRSRHPELVVHTHLVDGRPAEQLVETSGGAQLLVVGSRGHGGFTGMLIGSVSAAVMGHARCPVAVVHP